MSVKTQFKLSSSERNFLTTQNQELPSWSDTSLSVIAFKIMRHNLRAYSLFVWLYSHVGHSSPTRISALWQQGTRRFSSLLYLKHGALCSVRAQYTFVEWIDFWRTNGWICIWRCKLREKRHQLEGNMFELTLAKEFPSISKLNHKFHPVFNWDQSSIRLIIKIIKVVKVHQSPNITQKWNYQSVGRKISLIFFMSTKLKFTLYF